MAEELTVEIVAGILRTAASLTHLANKAMAADATLVARIDALHAEGKVFGPDEMDASLAIMRAARPAPKGQAPADGSD